MKMCIWCSLKILSVVNLWSWYGYPVRFSLSARLPLSQEKSQQKKKFLYVKELSFESPKIYIF